MDKQEAEIREKLKQEKKREERKNREAFSELLREDMDEGFIKPKMRWKVISKLPAWPGCLPAAQDCYVLPALRNLGLVPTVVNVACVFNRTPVS